MNPDNEQIENHVAAYYRRWIHRHQEAPGCLSKATQDPTCKICFQGFVRLKSFCKHAKLHFEQNFMKCSFCGDEFFSKDALANHMRMPLETIANSRSPSPPGRPTSSVYAPSFSHRESKEANYSTSQFVLKDPSPTFQGQSSKPYTGGAKPPSYWEWVREAYPHIQLSEEVIQQLEAESKNNDNITDEASFQEMVDLIMSKEKQKQANDGLKPPELPSTFRGKQSFGAPGKINCHLCNANIRRIDFQAHMLVAHSAASIQQTNHFNCPVCPKTFATSKDYFQHKIMAHSEPVSPQRPPSTFRQCNLCGEACQSLDALLQHANLVHGLGGGDVQSETMEDSILCPLCTSYRVNRRNKDQLDRHLLLNCSGRLFIQKLTAKRIRDLSMLLNDDSLELTRLFQECKLLQWNDELSSDPNHWTSRSNLNSNTLPNILKDGLAFIKAWANELEDWHSEVSITEYIRLEAEAEKFSPHPFGEYNRNVEPGILQLLPQQQLPRPSRLDYDSLILIERIDSIFRQYNLCDAVDIERSRVQTLWEEAVRVGRAVDNGQI
ncbi:uncharacterized protein LOC136038217 isoform X2 [Artemia franciscana]